MNRKILVVLEKKRSRSRIVFTDDETASWFVNVNFIRKKDGMLQRSMCIVDDDMKFWLNHYISEGWVETNEKKI